MAFSVVFALGLRLNQFTLKESYLITLVSFVGFIILGYVYYLKNGHFVPTQTCKHPPSAYYLSYAITMSILAWLKTKEIDKYWNKLGRAGEVIMFIAQNTLWIYLWHILCLRVVSRIHINSLLLNYILVYSGAVLITFIQITTVQKWLLTAIQNENARKNLKLILTG
jgi:hypothetical protein